MILTPGGWKPLTENTIEEEYEPDAHLQLAAHLYNKHAGGGPVATPKNIHFANKAYLTNLLKNAKAKNEVSPRHHGLIDKAIAHIQGQK